MRLSDGAAVSKWIVRLAVAALPAVLSCTPDTLFNATASLGGTTPGGRGRVGITFINNTPFRAVFTFGTYDPQNTGFTPDFEQFHVSTNAEERLEGNSESPIISLTCARAVSLGGQDFISRLKDEDLVADASEEALEPGIAFSDRPLDDADAGKATAGRAPAVLTLQGAEFPCGALLIYTFEVDATQPSGFRVDLQVVLP